MNTFLVDESFVKVSELLIVFVQILDPSPTKEKWFTALLNKSGKLHHHESVIATYIVLCSQLLLHYLTF